MPVEKAPQAQETPRAPAQAKSNIAAQVREYLRAKPADADGWIRFGGSGEIIKALGIPGTPIPAALYFEGKRGSMEFQRDGRHMRAVRFVDTTPVRRYREPEPIEREPDEPEPRRLVLTGVALVPDTPHLAGYAEARKIAQGNPMLRVELSEHDREQVLSEATRLYHWLRASQGKR